MSDDDREAQQYLEEQEQQYLKIHGENENGNESSPEGVRRNSRCDVRNVEGRHRQGSPERAAEVCFSWD
jgi:hypothetical protein